MMNKLIDDEYWHLDPKLIYSAECVEGPGVSGEESGSTIALSCSCVDVADGACNSEELCECVRKFKRNYDRGLLLDEKLFGNLPVLECGFARCKCSATCSNDIVQRGPSKSLRVTETAPKGLGVVTTAFLKKGTFICEYAGELIGQKEGDARMEANTGSGTYILSLTEHCEDKVIKTIVDATFFANIGRYINHSCEPNCSLIPVRASSNIPKICIFTNQDVPAGQELSYHYNSGNADVSLSATVCHCKSEKCAGFLPKNSGSLVKSERVADILKP